MSLKQSNIYTRTKLFDHVLCLELTGSATILSFKSEAKSNYQNIQCFLKITFGYQYIIITVLT